MVNIDCSSEILGLLESIGKIAETIGIRAKRRDRLVQECSGFVVSVRLTKRLTQGRQRWNMPLSHVERLFEACDCVLKFLTGTIGFAKIVVRFRIVTG